MALAVAILVVVTLSLVDAFLPPMRAAAPATGRRQQQQQKQQGTNTQLFSSPDTITSPFESGVKSGTDDGPLPLTLENVELVLDEMRPYLMSDG